jgi:hypothetical protein
MTAHAHDILSAGHNGTKLIWAAIAVVAVLAVTAIVLVLVTRATDDSPTAPSAVRSQPVPSSQVANNDCGPTRIVHPC